MKLFLRIGWALIISFVVSACSVFSGGNNNEVNAFVVDEKIKSAEQLYVDGNIEAAEKMYLDVNAASPNNALVLYRLGTISYRKGNTEKASTYFESVIEVDPRHAKAHFNLATIRLMQAESHFKYYIATADPKADIEKLSVLIGAIEEYASSDKKQ